MEFSIITPSYKQLDWLELCIASVAAQAAEAPLKIEHIVQDAGSPGLEDFCLRLRRYLDKYQAVDSDTSSASQSPKPILSLTCASGYTLKIFQEADNGMYDAINRGLTKSSGAFCAWLNCDEQYLRCTLASVRDFLLSHPGVDLLCGDTILVSESLLPQSYRRQIIPRRPYIQTCQLGLHSSSLFFRRSVIEKGFLLASEWRSIGDAVWFSRLLDAGLRIRATHRPYSLFVLGRNNLSQQAISTVEAQSWRKSARANKALSFLLKLDYRFRKFWAGAYRARTIDIEYFSPSLNGPDVRHFRGKIGFSFSTL